MIFYLNYIVTKSDVDTLDMHSVNKEAFIGIINLMELAKYRRVQKRSLIYRDHTKSTCTSLTTSSPGVSPVPVGERRRQPDGCGLRRIEPQCEHGLTSL